MKNKSMIVFVAVLAIGCNKEESVTSEDSYAKYREENPHTVSSISERLEKTAYKMEGSEIVEINLDDLSFGEAFNIERRAKGEGQTFWWHGKQYTTNIRREDK